MSRYINFFLWTVLGILMSFVTVAFLLPGYKMSLRQQLFENSQDLSWSLNVSDTNQALQEIYDLIQTEYYDTGAIDQNKMSRQAVASFVNALGDPFSSYLEPIENKDFTEALEWTQTIEGIGAYLGKKDAGVVVEEVIKSSPASEAGIKALDLIIKINGSGIQNLSLPEVVKKIRGPRGTTVDLTLVRANSGTMEILQKKLTRDSIVIPSVSAKMLTGKNNQNIAYIALSLFGEETNRLMINELTTILQKKPIWLILDLRGNGGGLLPEAVTIASHFLPLGSPVVMAKYRLYNTEMYKSEWTHDIDIPVVILVDEWTASASEILALALKENRKDVTIVGSKTFGKWSIQSLQPVSFGGSVKLTVGKRFSPSGKTIDHEWIVPDIVVSLDLERYRKDNNDTQLEKAKSILSQKAL